MVPGTTLLASKGASLGQKRDGGTQYNQQTSHVLSVSYVAQALSRQHLLQQWSSSGDAPQRPNPHSFSTPTLVYSVVRVTSWRWKCWTMTPLLRHLPLLSAPPPFDHRYSRTRAAHVPTNLCLPWPRPRQLA